MLRPITAPVAQFGDNIGTGILMEGPGEMRMLPPAGLAVQHGTNLTQTAHFEDPGQRAWEGVEALVNDDRIQFVGQMARRAIELVVGDGPA